MKSSVLNLIYRFVYSESQQLDSAVVEFVHVCARYSGRTVVAASLLIVGTAHAAGLPGGGQVVAGSGSISQSGNTLTVTQTSNRMATNWQQFSIDQGNTVNFAQPSASSVALNRVLGSNPSVIQGALHANGQVFLINPNGVLFSPTAQVNVGGIVASTLNITNKDFMAGHYHFAGSSTAAVRNEGSVMVGTGGSAAFIAAHIENTGSINAPQGNVLMGAGNDVRLDLGGPVKIEVKKGALDALINQGGVIRANGGQVYLTAKAAGDIASAAINHSGITEAKTLVTGKKGAIYLVGDMAHGQVNVSGTLNASAPTGGKGGFIETSAAHVKIHKVAQIHAGHWLIDPNDFTIASSGGDISGAALGTALGSGNVTIQTSSTGVSCTGVTGCGTGSTGNGDILVKDNVSWSSGKTLTLNAYRNIRILSTLDASGGTGGKVVLDYGQGAVAVGNAATYDFGLTGSGFTGAINLQAGSNFTTKLGSDGTPVNWTVVTALGAQGSTTGTDLQGINGNLSGNFVLGTNINASTTSTWNSNTGFMPIGNNTTNFTGNFDGLGHVINGLVINRSGVDYQGLFGAISGNATLANVGLIGGSVKGKGSVGALAGSSDGSSSTTGAITSSYATSSVTGSGAYIGGLVGANFAAIITNSYATGNVSGSGGFVGGLVGNLDAAFHNTSASVSNSYATGNVSGNTTTGDYIGGLVGVDHAALISNSYATGNVSGSKNEAGGLVGDISNSNIFLTVINSYATGIVSGTGTLGGLVGGNSNGTISNSFWDTVTTGQTTSAGGGTGKTTSNMKSLTTFTGVGWNIDDAGSTGKIWRIYNGNSYPLLRNLLTPLAVTANSGSRVYDGTITSNLGVSYSTTPNANLLGSAIVTASAKNAGARTLNVSGVYSNQNGYDISNVAGTLTITAKPVSLLASKTYDGSTSLTGVVTVNTGISGETLNYSGATANDAHVATANKFINAITLTDGTGGLASNYTLPTMNNTNAPVTINAATLSPTLSNVSVTKVYDGTTAAPSGFTPAYTLTGLVSGDTAATLGNTGAVYNSKDVATANTVTVSGLSITSITGNHSSAASDYVLNATSKTVAGTITAKTVGLSASKTYDGTTGLTGAVTITTGIGGESLSYSGAAANDAHVATANKFINAITLADDTGGSGGLAANYALPALNNTNAPVTITAATLTPTLSNTGVTKVYDGTTAAPSGFTPAYTITGLISGDTAARLGNTGSVYNSKDEATANTVTVSGLSITGITGNHSSAASDYVLDATSKTVAGTITPKTVGLSATKTYDGSTGLTGSAVNITTGISGETLNYSGATANDAHVATANKFISAITLTDGTGGLASNYTLPTLNNTNAPVTINAATLSPTLSNTGVTKVYDGTTAAPSGFTPAYTLTGLVSGDTAATLGNTGSVYNSKDVATANTVTVSGLSITGITSNHSSAASDYVLDATSKTVAGTITKVPLLVTANNASKTYDGLAYSGGNGVSYSGFVNSETSSVLGGSLIYNGTSQGAKNAGNYVITPGGQSAANYTLNYVDGTLTINKASLTLAGTRVYNGLSSVAGSVLTASGVNGETFTVTGAGDTSNLASPNVQTNGTLATITGLTLGTSDNGGLLSNYNALSTAGSSVTITKAALTVSGITAANKVYDGNTTATTDDSGAVYSGLVSGDNLSITTTGTFSDKNVASGKTVTLTSSYNGADANNYNITSQSTTSADITAKALNVSYSATNKIYDGTTSASVTGSSNDIVSGDVITFSQTAAFSDRNVGASKLVNIINISLGGTDATNYALQNTTATAHADITPRPTTGTKNVNNNISRLFRAVVTSSQKVADKIGQAATPTNIWKNVVVIVKKTGIRLPGGLDSDKKH